LYVNRIRGLSLSGEIIQRFNNLSIVYTPIHGSGVELVPKSLKAFGFTNVHCLESQCVVDGDFPTVHSPNPEEPEAMKLALELGRKVNADLILATDPDADRVGVAVKDRTGNFVLLNGNQTASVMIYYLLEKWKEKGWITGNEFIAKTIVTSELLRMLANDYRVECIDVLTGFKYIAEIIRQQEGSKRFIGGGEESYGYLVGDFVRDKDAVISCCIIAETTAWAISQEKSFYDVLIDLYCRYGFYKERLISITRKGKSGAEEISAMMRRYRTMPPKMLGGVKVTIIRDYNNATQIALDTGTTSPVESPRSDVLQFFLEDGSKITVRPSGTEPKIKFYFGIRGTLASDKDFDKVNAELDLRIEQIVSDMEI
ncbi:MAG TPA: phospho-sugar mutase, partial [Bacteroidales bacterium]|nr:phospho-sugar mutase [Bacteroidales bacterium]